MPKTALIPLRSRCPQSLLSRRRCKWARRDWSQLIALPQCLQRAGFSSPRRGNVASLHAASPRSPFDGLQPAVVTHSIRGAFIIIRVGYRKAATSPRLLRGSLQPPSRAVQSPSRKSLRPCSSMMRAPAKSSRTARGIESAAASPVLAGSGSVRAAANRF